MAVEFFMPKVTDHMDVGEVIRWLVKEGDTVQEGQTILEVETDKVAVELEAPASGVLKGIRAGVKEGTQVPVGETIAFIAEPDEEVPTLPALTIPEDEESAKETAPAPPQPEPEQAEPGRIRTVPAVRRIAREMGVDLTQVQGTGPEGRIKKQDVLDFVEAQKAAAEIAPASPVARRLARELGIDLAQVSGSGPKGRITREDVEAYAEAQVAPAPTPAPAEEEVEWLDLTPVQRRTGERMLESVQTAPQFALTTEVDMTAALDLREAMMDHVVAQTGERLSVTAILAKIVADALKHYPRANASFEQGRIRLYRNINVGVAVGADEGLVVPVIKEADQKSLAEITRAIASFQEKARAMRFGTDDLSGGTFTISNLGMYGIDQFYAIVNPPQSAILAVGRIVKTPVGMPDETVALRPMMRLTLSIDHRSMDGVQGAQFLAHVRERLEQPYLLL